MKYLKKIVKIFLKKIYGIKLDARIRQNLSRIKKKKSNKKINIVFIVQFSEMWNSLKSVYESFKNNASYETFLFAVPRYKHNELRKGMKENEFYLENDVFNYLKKSGYDVIDAREMDKWKDLRKLNPDIVFYQRPYQPHYPRKYNFSKVSKYALVCFVPYGVLLSKDIHIKVNINNDALKSAFIFFTDDQLAKKYFDDNKYSMHSKAQIIKNPRFDLISMDDVIKTSYKPKTFLWTPRWYVGKANNKSNFLLYLKPIISFFGEHKDLKLIIRPHPLMFKNFIDHGVMTQCEINNLKNDISTLKNIIFDDNKDYRQSFVDGDVLISDFSSLIVEYFLTGKPIIYCGETNDFNELGSLISNYFICVNDEKSLLANIKKISCNDYVPDNKKNSCIKHIIDDKNQYSILEVIKSELG